MTERDVAAYLDLDPRQPLYWPVDVIRRLMRLREAEGHDAFLRELYIMMVR